MASASECKAFTSYSTKSCVPSHQLLQFHFINTSSHPLKYRLEDRHDAAVCLAPWPPGVTLSQTHGATVCHSPLQMPNYAPSKPKPMGSDGCVCVLDSALAHTAVRPKSHFPPQCPAASTHTPVTAACLGIARSESRLPGLQSNEVSVMRAGAPSHSPADLICSSIFFFLSFFFAATRVF